MTRSCFSLLILLWSTLPVFAQHPLEGTWEMVSISGKNADGENFYLDSSTVRETKIITPTHYMLNARDKVNNAWIFNRCYAGTTKMDAHNYFESPLLSSLRIFENVTTDFTWKIEGDRFIQSGTITRPDGKKIILDEFIFRRSPEKNNGLSKNYVGTWKLTGTSEEGMLIITPTHWMTIIKNGEKLIEASGGTFRKTGSAAYFIPAYSSTGNLKELPFQTEKDKVRYGERTFVK
jgi:hypothetical protein